MEEVARLEKEIQMLQQPQQDFERETEKEVVVSLKNLEMEREAVMKEIIEMRKEHYEKINYGKDCQVLTFMVDQVSLRLQDMKMQKKFLEEQLEKMKRDEEMLQSELDEKKTKRGGRILEGLTYG